MTTNKEVRYISELRADVKQGIVKGTAIVFNSESEDLGFRETINNSAATQEFLNEQDIVMLYNHDENSGVLARSKYGQGSLKYSVDERGVHFEFKAKDSDMWIVEAIERGDLDACSFAFSVENTDEFESWEKRNDGTYLRTIKKFKSVSDFSIVVHPAYSATSCNTRGLEQLKANEQSEVDELEAAKKAEKRKQHEKYMKTLTNKYL